MKDKNRNNPLNCANQSLSTTAYAVSVILGSQLTADELNILGNFLTALADLLLLTAAQMQSNENCNSASSV